MSEEKVPLYIKKSLYEKVKRFVETQGGFKSVEEVVEFVVEEALFGETVEPLSKDDEEKVKDRLRSLGYM